MSFRANRAHVWVVAAYGNVGSTLLYILQFTKMQSLIYHFCM